MHSYIVNMTSIDAIDLSNDNDVSDEAFNAEAHPAFSVLDSRPSSVSCPARSSSWKLFLLSTPNLFDCRQTCKPRLQARMNIPSGR